MGRVGTRDMMGGLRPIVLAIALLIALLFASVPVRADEKTYTVILDQYPPYYYWDKKAPKGKMVDVLDEVFKRMGIKVEYRSSTWKRSLYDLKSGDITGLCAGLKTPEREKFALYSESPLFEIDIWAATLSGGEHEPVSIEDLRGLSVGVIHGYTYGDVFGAAKGIHKQPYLTDELMIRNLLAGRVDAIVGNRMVLENAAKKIGMFTGMKFVFRIQKLPLYFMFSRAHNPQINILAAEFEAALQTMKTDGSFYSLSGMPQDAF